MARLQRIAPLGIPQHIIQRGNNRHGKGECGRARSIIPTGGNPVPARQASHRVANIGQAEVTLNVKRGGRKAAGRKRKRKLK